jgi:hypothetical protein
LIGATGAAAALLVLLLLCLSPAPRTVRAGAEDQVSATGWTPNALDSRVIDPWETVWEVISQPVRITFKSQALSAPAYFTFTSAVSTEVLPSPYLTSPYFFDLAGTYVINDRPVSLGASGIEIELSYTQAELGRLEPRSLQFYRRVYGVWEVRGGQVDLEAKTITLRTDETGTYGIGGQGPTLYIPLIVNK